VTAHIFAVEGCWNDRCADDDDERRGGSYIISTDGSLLVGVMFGSLFVVVAQKNIMRSNQDERSG